MNLTNIFSKFNRRKTAAIAKEHLQIVVSHERTTGNNTDILSKLRQELLYVVSKYYPIDKGNLTVGLQHEGSCSVLELNLTLPAESKLKTDTEMFETV